MDIAPVTNIEFKKCVDATGYITMAEKKPSWEEMAKQLPAGTPKPPDSLLQPGSLVFQKSNKPISNLNDVSQWWAWVLGTSWKHPNGPGSDLKGLENHPVVHIAYEDALAYCEWSGKRLPTEAEWEFAARGKGKENIFFWGNDISQLPEFANTWTGDFPYQNNLEDGYELTSPVNTFPANSNGVFDMAGNVWELTSDWYDKRTGQKVIKGGSFLCNVSYCASFRISARMGCAIDSSTDHVGFRTVKDP